MWLSNLSDEFLINSLGTVSHNKFIMNEIKYTIIEMLIMIKQYVLYILLNAIGYHWKMKIDES